MNEIDIPIIKKSGDLHKTFYEYRKLVPKQDRLTIYMKTEETILDILECFLRAGYAKPGDKVLVLERASAKLNIVRFFIRTMKEVRSIDNKKYLVLQEMIDEIGRMLGGWIKSSNMPR